MKYSHGNDSGSDSSYVDSDAETDKETSPKKIIPSVSPNKPVCIVLIYLHIVRFSVFLSAGSRSMKQNLDTGVSKYVITE